MNNNQSHLASISIEEEEEQSPPPPSQTDSETYMIGFIIANIVGVQYYSGRISGREIVGLVREPLNPYDSNAIKVINTRSIQVGHIEKKVSSVLAPLIDSNLVHVEGIVPKNPKNAFRYKIPCHVHVFARVEAFETVKLVFSNSDLCFLSENNPMFSTSESVVVKDLKEKKKGSLDEIFKLLDENLSQNVVNGEIEPPKDFIIPELFLHQKQGLHWLYHRENSNELPPFWVENEDGSGFENVLTNYQTDKRPDPLRGGIFADDMGLGKTLTLLSLIALDKCKVSDGKIEVVETENEQSVINIYKRLKSSSKNQKTDECTGRAGPNKKQKTEECTGRARPNKKQKTEEYTGRAGPNKKQKTEEYTGWAGPKMTLVVCPPSVFSTWITQLTDHTQRGKLKAYLYYGERTQDVSELQQYDIVLTTYSTLSSAFDSSSNDPVKKIDWWRVILDEAHVIKNHRAKQSEAVNVLKARNRWVVTGTPIQNGSMDLFSLMKFLSFDPFSTKSYWDLLVQRPIAQGDPNGLSRLQALMAALSLRRTKEKALIGLPPKTIHTCHVELSPEERKLYDEMETEAKNFVANYIAKGNVTSNYSTVLSIILRLRQLCTHTDLVPPDVKASLSSSNFEDVSNKPELLKKLVILLQDSEDLDCPICLSPPSKVIITTCAHIFCENCITRALKTSKSSCPLCRNRLNEFDLFSPPPEHTPAVDKSTFKPSSKATALLKLLEQSRTENPAVKSVVFSQFRKLLLLLENPLKEAGFKTLRLDGVMSAKKRASVIEEFGGGSGSSAPTVLLASLKASGTGINLTAGSRVYLMEPWWNPAVEEQAMDRVHRIGQKEAVKVVKMVANDSIDERILLLQEKKHKLAKDAFGKKGKDEKREVNLEDLRTLMSL